MDLPARNYCEPDQGAPAFGAERLDPGQIGAIERQVIASARLPLQQAVTLPRAAYVNEDYFRHEAGKVLASGWICLAHVSQLKQAGSYLALDLLDEPLLVTRGPDGAVRVLSRVCPHRGADIMHPGFGMAPRGVAKRLVCPYHVWSFGLDGKLKTCAEMQRAEAFDKKDWALAELRSAVWEGFVFVNLDGAASPLAEQYADFAKVVAPWNCAEMEVAIELDWECDFNWKVMVENWMESYHHMGIHHDTLQPVMPAKMTWTEAENPHFIRCHLPFKQAVADDLLESIAEGRPIPGFRPIEGLTLKDHVEWGLYLGHPCFMFLTMRDRVLWYRLQPISAERCRLMTATLVSKRALEAPGFAETVERETRMLADFHAQDMKVNTAVQAGLRSSRAVQGRLSHLEEPVWMIQRYVAARLQGCHPGM